tara:strand:+ start:1822 stop:2742 length:921 start_codon:yes stop_codon:yes gene_type:complete
MITKYIVSVKSTGISYDIIRLIILTDLAEKYNRQLIFLTKVSHIPILKDINPSCTYIPYVSGHASEFNSFNRKEQLYTTYALKYKSFLKSTYLNNIAKSGLSMGDISYIYGGIRDITDSSHNMILFDYCKNIKHTTELLHSIPPVSLIMKDAYYSKYTDNILSINVKIDDPDNSRVYELWDEIIPKLKQEYNMPILLISGNNDIKKYFGDKHNCLYEIKETEIKYSFKRNGNTIRGKPDQVYDDLIICAHTHFIPFTKIREDYRHILSKYSDIKFVKGSYVEKFDVLAEYLSMTFLKTKKSLLNYK